MFGIKGILLFSILATNSDPMSIPNSQSEVDVFPKQLFTKVGKTVKITCSIKGENKDGIIWTQLESGSDAAPSWVYDGRQILFKYKEKKRYSIEGSCNQKCTLMITNVMASDAGTFTCTNSDSTAWSSANLTVIASTPECLSRTRLDDVMMINDCDLPPDNIKLDCIVQYYGIDPPAFEISSSTGPDLFFKELGQKSIGSWFNQTFALGSITHELNGTIFSCRLQNTGPNEDITCEFPEAHISYFFKPSVFPNNDGYTCYENTSSQQCTYIWNSSSNLKKESKSPHLKKSEVEFLVPTCLVKCPIRNKVCQAESDPKQPDKPNEINAGVNMTLSVSLFMSLLALAAMVIFLFCKRNLLCSPSQKCARVKSSKNVGALPLPVELVEMIGWKMFALMLSSELESAQDKHIDTYKLCRKNIKTVGGGIVYQFLSNIHHRTWRKHPRKAFIRKFYTKFLQRVILIRLSVMTETFDCRSMFLQVITTEVLTEEERERLQDVDDRTKKLLSYITQNGQTKIESFLKLGFIFRSHVFEHVFSGKELPNLITGYMREHLFKIKEKLLEMKLEAPMTRTMLEHPDRLCPLKATKLVDLLFEKSCINASQRKFIEKQPDDRSKAEIITDLLIHGCKETFFKTVVDYLGDTEQNELYYSIFEKYDEAIEEDGKIEPSSEISQIACSDNQIYALHDKEKVLDVYDGNQKLCDTIKVAFLGKSYGITYCSGSIIISDWENNCLFQIIIPEKAVIVKSVEGLSQGISTTMSDDVLAVVQKEWKNRIDIYRANAVSGIISLVKPLNIPETIQFVHHASQTSEGRFIISCKTKDECFLGEISENPVRITRTFTTFGPSINQQLLCIPNLIQVDECGRIYFLDTTSIFRVFILNPLWLESDLQVILPNDKYELDEPLGLSYEMKKQLLIVNQKNVIRIFKLLRRI